MSPRDGQRAIRFTHRLLAAGLAERRSCSRQSLASPLTAAALRHSLLTAAPPPRRLRLEPQVLRKLPDLECYTNLRHYGIVAFGLFGVIFYFLGCCAFPSQAFLRRLHRPVFITAVPATVPTHCAHNPLALTAFGSLSSASHSMSS